MSDKPIPIASAAGFVAPTPQNTPLNPAPVAGLSKPTVPDIAEGEEKEDASDEDDDVAAALASRTGTQAAIYSMVQNKLEGLVGKSSGYIESLPLPVRKRIEGLKGVHNEYTKLEKQYKTEMLELDRKYLGLYKPLFERRRAIMSGEAEPTADELKAGHELNLKDDPEAEPLPEKEENEEGKDLKGIPEFWLTALRNHMDISEMITERDEEAIKSLKDITLDYLPGTQGYVVTFHFAPNAFFTNETLTKTYYYKPDLDYLGDWNYLRAEGCTINWKEDKDLTKTIEVRKQRNKNTNRTRIVRKSKKTPSFFDFFSPPVAPDDDDVDDIDEDELDEIRYKLELDYDLGEDLKERVIPRAIDYFTGKALEYDMLDEDEGDFEDNEDEDEDEEEEESSEEEVPKKKKGGKGAAAAAGGNQECKNQ